jgi:cell division protein FtsZ
MTASTINNTQGANALKLEPETQIQEQTISENLNPEIDEDSTLENISIENLEYMENNEQIQKDEEASFAENNLAGESENKDRTPTLFSDDENLDTFTDKNHDSGQDFSDTFISNDQDEEEEDLEIPAFLRKQKN